MTIKIDTLVMVIGDQSSGKSNQMRSIFEECELRHAYKGYPTSRRIKYQYNDHSGVQLLVRLSSWHERGQCYADVKMDIERGCADQCRRYKVFIPAQVAATKRLVGGEELFIKLFADFHVRRGVAVWLSPDSMRRRPFEVSPAFAAFMSTRRHVSAMAIDSGALRPSENPTANSINARLLADLLFRI